MSAENHVINYDKSVKDLTSTFQQHESSVELIVKKYKDLNTQLSSLPSDFVTKLREITKANDDMVKSQNKLNNATNEALKQSKLKAEAEIKELDAIIKKLKVEQEEINLLSKKTKQTKENTKATQDQNRERAREIEMQAKREKAVDNFNKAEAKSQQLLVRSESLYNKIQTKVNGMTQAYNDLAAKKQLGIDLNTKEERTLLLMETRLKKYGEVLKSVDANIGKHQRNVGNYASGWNGLGNSINQITRELPAFTFSAQTGFLALSNNIPMLADEIKRVSDNVKEMRAQGQKVPGVMSQILTSFISWQTALSLFVTLITVYGKEIGGFFEEIFKGAKKVDVAKLSLAAYNEALKGGEYQKAYTDISKVGMAFEQAGKGTISKKEALKVYNSTLGETFGKTNDYNRALELYNKNSKRYIDATLAMASANNLFNKNVELNIKLTELQTNKQINLFQKVGGFLAKMKGGFAGMSVEDVVKMEKDFKIGNIEKEMEANEKAIEGFFDTYRENSKGLDMPDFFGGDDEKTKKTKENSKQLIKDRAQAVYELKRVQLERQREEAKFAEDNDTYFTKEMELEKLSYDNKVVLAKLEISDKKLLNIKLDTLREENLANIEKIGRDELVAEQDTAKKIVEIIQNYWKLRSEATKEGVEKELASKALNHEDERFAQEKDILNLRKELEGLNKDSPNYYSKLLELREAEHKYDKMHLQYLISIEKDPLRKKELQNALEALDIQFDTDKLKIAKDSLSSFEKSLSDIFSKAGFGEVANLLDGSFIDSIKNIKDWKDAAAAAMEAVSAISTEVFARMKANSDAYYENQFSLLEKEHETSIKYANNNVDAKTVLEEKYTARKLELKRQQAKQEKEMATFQALINVATGITSALTQAPPYSFILAALVGVMGAAQIASIQAQPLPQFYNGTMNASEGWAIVDELRPEVHTDKNGNLKSMGSSGGANLRYLEQGDKIYKSHADFFNEMDDATRFGGITIEKNDSFDYSQFDDIIGKHIANIQQNSINLDVKGFTTYQGRRNSRNRILNKKVRFGK